MHEVINPYFEMHVQPKIARYKYATESNTRSDRTRIRLLTTASRVFAEKGFQESTIAEICKQADTNVASINYHFVDKETMYLEAWRYAFQLELAQFPPDGGVSDLASAEERLAGRIRSLINRIADDQSYSFAIINRELAQPTRLLATILEHDLHPQRMLMINLLKECLGCEGADLLAQYCHASIMGQCFQLLRLKHIIEATPEMTRTHKQLDIKSYTEHVVRFSLAGIQAVRSQFTK